MGMANLRTGPTPGDDMATGVSGLFRTRSVSEGAEASVHLATPDADGPRGILWGHLWTAGGLNDAYGPLPR